MAAGEGGRLEPLPGGGRLRIRALLCFNVVFMVGGVVFMVELCIL